MVLTPHPLRSRTSPKQVISSDAAAARMAGRKDRLALQNIWVLAAAAGILTGCLLVGALLFARYQAEHSHSNHERRSDNNDDENLYDDEHPPPLPPRPPRPPRRVLKITYTWHNVSRSTPGRNEEEVLTLKNQDSSAELRREHGEEQDELGRERQDSDVRKQASLQYGPC